METNIRYINEDNRAMGIKLKKNQKYIKAKSVIEIPHFYLLKTAQSLIEYSVEELHKDYLGETLQYRNKMDRSNGKKRFSTLEDQESRKLFTGIKLLKFKNQEAYVYGDIQLIYFSDIREHMKNNQKIELVLINIENSHEGQDSPRHDENPKFTTRMQKQPTQTRRDFLNQQHCMAGLSKFSVKRQKRLFPPMVNTLYLENEIEYHMRMHEYSSNVKSGHINNPSKIEYKMKSYLTEIYNTASNFFWYPPDKLLT